MLSPKLYWMWLLRFTKWVKIDQPMKCVYYVTLTCNMNCSQLNIRYRWYGRDKFQWRHNKSHGISNYRRLDCLVNRLIRRRLNKHQRSASRAFVTGEFPAQRASDSENVSIWWRHHDETATYNYCHQKFPCQGYIECVHQDLKFAELDTLSPWWRHQMETVSALLVICPRWIPRTKASDAGLWCFLWSAPG